MKTIMLRPAHGGIVILALLAGLALRAVTPMGYMPASSGDGLLFELCPEQLPPGFVLRDSANARHDHHHQHGSDESRTTNEADQCDIGHLLFLAIAVDESPVDALPTDHSPDLSLPDVKINFRTTLSAYISRAPPA